MLLEEGQEDDPMKCLIFVDAIQRLGIDYHFREEIETKLWRLHCTSAQTQALDQVSLYFRLLRQGGYHVHAG